MQLSEFEYDTLKIKAVYILKATGTYYAAFYTKLSCF
jgi:hypothetical protein